MTLYQFPLNAVEEIAVRITNGTPAIIVDGTDGAWDVPWFQVNENNGSTPTVTVDYYDGTTARYFGAAGVVYRAKALTAGQSVLFDNGIFVPKGTQIRVTVTVDAAGHVDVIGVKKRRQST